MTSNKVVTNNCEIDGYIRDIEKSLHPQIVPSSINHLIYSYYDPWFKLKHFPHNLSFIYPKPPLYHNKNNNTYHFIICPHYEDTRNIYTYNCNDDEWQKLTEYPPHFDAGCHGAIIDENKHELYIFLGQKGIFGKYNLETKTWTQCDTLFAKSVNPACIWLPDPINEIHAIIPDQVCNLHFDNDNKEDTSYVHAIYTDKHGKFVKASNYTLDADRSYLIRMSIENKELLISIGGVQVDYDTDDRIWFCELMDCEWKLFPNRMPCKASAKFTNATVFGQILILQTMDEDAKSVMYFLEIENCKDNNDHQWIQFDMEVPQTLEIAIDGHNYLYFMDFIYDNKILSKIHLSTILPSSLYLKYI